jgi:TonB family protein
MNWWHYLLLVNFYLVLFFGFYALLLRKETFFQLNRIYLVAASLLSFAIPLIQVDWVKNLFITQSVQQTIYSGPIAMVYNFTPTAQSALTLGEVLNAVYIIVTLFLIIRLAWQLVVLKKAIETPSPSAAYSFFKKISLGENASQSQIIADHEQVHAGQWHSVDVMIIETVMIINWFNPVVYLYRFAIKYIHEFIADREVIQAGTDKVDYAMLLLSQTFEVESHSLVTPFYNHSLLKQRIMMLQKNRSQRIALAKYGLSAPLFILMLIFSSATVNNSKAVAAINKKTEHLLLKPAADVVDVMTDNAKIPAENKPIEPKYIKIAEDISPEINVDTVPKKGPVFSQVEEQPGFPGGYQAFGQYLANNIKYPTIDKENKIEGRVIVTFVVETDGTLSDVKAVRGPSETLKAEAIRVLLRSPKWKPGIQNNHVVRVAYTVPIAFTLPKTIDGGDANKIYAQVDRQPSFPGGLEAFGKYLSNTIRFPKEDREAGRSGRVICTFVVETDGTLTDIKSVRAPSETMAKEAVRVLSISPKWQPGYKDDRVVRVSYTVPINYALGEENDEPAKKETRIGDHSNNPPPLYILDGVEVKATGSPLSLIPQDKIERMEILKDETATKLYGDRGKYGVILITSKKEKQVNVLDLQSIGLQGTPLVFVDGKASNDLKSIDMKTIERMEVLKDQTATNLYGQKAKDGVILLYTKANKKTTKP